MVQKSSILRGLYGANLGSNWLVFEFSDVWPFSTFACNFGEVHLSSVSRKVHSCVSHIFIFVSIYILYKNHGYYKGEDFLEIGWDDKWIDGPLVSGDLVS